MLTPYHKRGNTSFDATVKEVERVEHEYKNFAKRITPANIAIFNQQNPHRFCVKKGADETGTLLKLDDNQYKVVDEEKTKADFQEYMDVVKAAKKVKVDVWKGANGSFEMTLWHHSRVMWHASQETQDEIDRISPQNGDMQIVRFVCDNRDLNVEYAVYSHHSGQTTFLHTQHNLDLGQNELHDGVLAVQVEPTDGEQQMTYTPMKHLVVTDDVLYYKNCEIPLQGCSDNGYILTNKLLNMFVEKDVKNEHVRSLVIAVANLSTPEGIEHAFKKGRYHLKNEILKHDLNMLTTAQAQHPDMFNGAQHLSHMTEKTGGTDILKTRIHMESAVGKVCSVKYSAVVEYMTAIEETAGFGKIGELAENTAKGIADAKTKQRRTLPHDLVNMLGALKGPLRKLERDTDTQPHPRPIMDNQKTCDKFEAGEYTVYHSTHDFMPYDISMDKNKDKTLAELKTRFAFSHKFFIHKTSGFTVDSQGVPQDNSAYVLIEMEHCAPKDTTIVFANTSYSGNTFDSKDMTCWYSTKENDTKFDPIKTRPSVLYEMVSWFQTMHNRKHQNNTDLKSPISARIVFEAHDVNKRAFVLRGSYGSPGSIEALTSVLILKGHQTKKHRATTDEENEDTENENNVHVKPGAGGHVVTGYRGASNKRATPHPLPVALQHKSPAKKVLAAASRASLDVNDAKASVIR